MSELMRWLTKLSLRLRSLFHRRAADGELDSELHFHLEHQIAAHVSEGMSPADARQTALRELGGIEQLKEECRDMRKTNYIHDFAQDLRYGLRMLRKSPGFTAIAILTLALGIGANTAIFTILDSAALRLLPVPHADQLVTVGQNIRSAKGTPINRNVHDDDSFVSYSEYRAYAKQNRVFSGLLAYSAFTETTLVRDKPVPIMGTLTSCNYFDVLKVQPERGRFFVDSDCAAPGESAVVVLNDSAWRSTFASDPAIIGKTITLNRTPFRVIGVAPPGFDGTVPVGSAFWAPVTMVKAFRPASEYLGDDYLSWLAMIGRLKPGISSRQAAANLSVIASGMNSLQKGRITTLTLGRATLLSMPSMRNILLLIGTLIIVAVGLVLLLACVNIANLLLARAAGRRKEIAVRLTVGASRGRLIRQLLTESLLLAFIGGGVGAFASMWSVAKLFHFAMAHMPIGPEIAFTFHITSDFRTWFYAFALSVITACFFGLAPALRSSRLDLTLAMKEDGAHSQAGTFSAGRLRNFLVGLQVAGCMLLLLASALLLHGLYRAQTVNPGFQMNNIEGAAFDLSAAGYTPQRAAIFQQQLQTRLAALPGVDEVVQAVCIPLGNMHDVTNFSTPDGGRDYNVEWNNVSANFFHVLGIPVIQGRTFTDAEEHSGTHVIILSESTARRFFPSQNPLSQVLRGYDEAAKKLVQWQVVGVVADAQVADLGDSRKLYIYEAAGPAQQATLNVMVHSAVSNPAIGKQMNSIFGALDPDLNVTIDPFSVVLEFWRAPARVVSGLSVILGILALLLASIGIYGMVSYGVSCRVREIGIRMALGADTRDVMWLVVRRAMFPVIIGIVIGAVCSAGVSPILAAGQALFGASPWDPVSFICTPLFLFLVALLASYIPARRAMRVDPMVALRYE
ncbi:MAG TPA: ABC transporter permease [Candidatus Acidoferrales bacterium]|nr:ABC transporter permease [Candidatus Acidoferrales bacterium]